jgi:hypothetical protein
MTKLTFTIPGYPYPIEVSGESINIEEIIKSNDKNFNIPSKSFESESAIVDTQKKTKQQIVDTIKRHVSSCNQLVEGWIKKYSTEEIKNKCTKGNIRIISDITSGEEKYPFDIRYNIRKDKNYILGIIPSYIIVGLHDRYSKYDKKLMNIILQSLFDLFIPKGYCHKSFIESIANGKKITDYPKQSLNNIDQCFLEKDMFSLAYDDYYEYFFSYLYIIKI